MIMRDSYLILNFDLFNKMCTLQNDDCFLRSIRIQELKDQINYDNERQLLNNVL